MLPELKRNPRKILGDATITGTLTVNGDYIIINDLMLKRQNTNTMYLRDSGDTVYKALRVGTIDLTSMRETSGNGSIKAANIDDSYVAFEGRNNGVDRVEVARIESAAEPRFQHTLPLNLGPQQEVTIATGAITLSSGNMKVTVQGGTGAGADDLATINGGADGDIIVLKPTTSGVNDTVTVKDGAGNIDCAGDFAMDSVRDRIMLQYDAGESVWCEVGTRVSNA